MFSFTRRHVRARRSALVLMMAGALAAGVLVQSVFARAQANPTNVAAPVLAAPPTIGDTLSVTPGLWRGSPTSFAYVWLRCPASGGAADSSDCTTIPGATSRAYEVDSHDVGNRLRVRETATNVDGAATAISSPSPLTVAPPDQNITGCPPIQQAGPLGPDEISPPARLAIDRTTSTPSVITRSTRAIQLRFHVMACDGRSVWGALVYATPTPYEQFTSVERATDSQGWATLTMTRLRFFPATPRQQNLIVFVRVRKPGEPLFEGISSRRLVSFRVEL
jgi:hypothetical protein